MLGDIKKHFRLAMIITKCCLPLSPLSPQSPHHGFCAAFVAFLIMTLISQRLRQLGNVFFLSFHFLFFGSLLFYISESWGSSEGWVRGLATSRNFKIKFPRLSLTQSSRLEKRKWKWKTVLNKKQEIEAKFDWWQRVLFAACFLSLHSTWTYKLSRNIPISISIFISTWWWGAVDSVVCGVGKFHNKQTEVKTNTEPSDS